jgi:N-acetylneuraminic acid mutarotase
MTRYFIALTALPLIAAATPGHWTTGPSLPVARSEVAIAMLDRRIYVIGGSANGNVDQSLVQVFRPVKQNGQVTGEWHDAAPLPRGLNHVGAVAYRGKVYTFGGFSEQNSAAVDNAYVYDPATNRWSSIAGLPHPLGSVSVAVLGEEIHLVGGREVHSVRTHWVYDPATNRYSERAPLPIGRDHMGLVGFEDRLYAVGGRIDTPAHNTSYLDIYDPATNAWTSGSPMPTARSGMAVVVYYGKVFAMGGEASGMASAFTTNEAYDPSTNAWDEFAPLPVGLHGTGAAVIGRRLYVPGGAPVPGGSRQSNALLIFTL